MLETNRKDLVSEKKKRVLQRLVGDLSARDPDLYYRSTSTVAAQIEGYIAKDAPLNGEEKALMANLTRRDIEVILSVR
ncbi:MAG: hypothetical protein AAGM21_13775 [Pseudomonadota bacterium]